MAVSEMNYFSGGGGVSGTKTTPSSSGVETYTIPTGISNPKAFVLHGSSNDSSHNNYKLQVALYWSADDSGNYLANSANNDRTVGECGKASLGSWITTNHRCIRLDSVIDGTFTFTADDIWGNNSTYDWIAI